MSRESFYKLAPGRRRKLLDAAAAEIAASGLQDASLNRILTRAGFSKGVAYHYFEDRDDLLVTVLRAHAAPENTLELAKLTKKTFWSTLEGTLREIAVRGARESAALTVARAVWALPADRRERGAFGELWKEMTTFVRQAVSRGRELGVIRDDLDEELLAAIVFAVGEVCDRWFLERGTTKELDAIFDLFRRMLEPPKRRTR